VLSDWYGRARESAFARKVTKYAIGSVIALVTSIVVFALLYVAHMSTTWCSILAFAAGAIPNWVLNRRWAWQQQGQVAFMREIVGYVLVSVLSLIVSSVATGFTNHEVNVLRVPQHTGLRVAIVTGSYVLVQAVLFVGKFLVYERWVFSGRSLRAAVRSRHQVWTAARANRTP
jgi:putative flippase GtrA